MKIEIEAYNPRWPQQFQKIKEELQSVLSPLNPRIEHFGSTAVPGLAAKPVIDILVGIDSKADLDNTIQLMMDQHYIYYETFTAAAPDRRLFVGLKNKQDISQFQTSYTNEDVIPHERILRHRLSHIHIWELGTEEWIRHLAFRDYLLAHPEITEQYAQLKLQLSQKTWKDGMEYNAGKDGFLKETEKKALRWYAEKPSI